jgi:hypothetical protein
MKKTIIKGLYLTSEGNAWHKSAKREIPITATGKVRFNGKVYDWQKLLTETKPKDPKTKQLIKKVIPKIKKSISIRELQKQGFKKTTISGLYATKNGLCYNLSSKRNLAITKGKITIHGKAYNVAKIILETFCKIPVRSGQITFKNGNDNDFDYENLEYTSTIKQTAPNETDIIQCIRLYFEIDKNLTRSNILFKFYLQEIALKRGFIHLHTGKDFDLFLDWVEAFRIKSKAEISRKHNYSTINGTNAINKYLSMLVNDCLQDMKNGILTIKDFAQKPLTATEKIKKANITLQETGFKLKIPLRKTGRKA